MKSFIVKNNKVYQTKFEHDNIYQFVNDVRYHVLPKYTDQDSGIVGNLLTDEGFAYGLYIATPQAVISIQKQIDNLYLEIDCLVHLKRTIDESIKESEATK